MAVVTLQVTLGSGITPILASGDLPCKWVIFQNNAAHSMRLGDSNITSSRGLYLAAGPGGGSYNSIATAPITGTGLKNWYVIGTSGDVLDVIYDLGG